MLDAEQCGSDLGLAEEGPDVRTFDLGAHFPLLCAIPFWVALILALTKIRFRIEILPRQKRSQSSH
jgi:hypothetical protein